MITPPNAGPIAREILTPTLLAAMAGGRSSLGTSCGTTACHAGTVKAPAAPTRKVNTSKLPGVDQPSPTIIAWIAPTPVATISTTIKNLRLWKISASAPAGIANKKIGSVLAAATSATTNGLGSRVVISQAQAALYIQPPTLETNVALQITAKAGWRNGAANDVARLEVRSAVPL